jgi:hypothetical protein
MAECRACTGSGSGAKADSMVGGNGARRATAAGCFEFIPHSNMCPTAPWWHDIPSVCDELAEPGECAVCRTQHMPSHPGESPARANITSGRAASINTTKMA